MKNIFDLTKREQRLVILIVVALVVVAFAKHWIEGTSNPPQASAPAQEQRTSTTSKADLNEQETESPSPQSSP
jgi:predicted metal-binding membrane protein